MRHISPSVRQLSEPKHRQWLCFVASFNSKDLQAQQLSGDFIPQPKVPGQQDREAWELGD